MFKKFCLLTFFLCLAFSASFALARQTQFLSEFYQKGHLNYPTVETENPILQKKLKSYFKKRVISKKEIQSFLIENGYYESEVFMLNRAYIIKNPVRTILVFKGNRFFSEKELRRIVKGDENRMGPFFSDFVERSIKDAYQDQGFLKVRVEKRYVKQNWKKWIYLNISEGSRIRIAELRVEGLFSKPNTQYENFIRNNSSDLIKKGFYSKEDLKIGYENLINHLKGQGYLQSKIYSDRIFFEKDKAFITVRLEEGFLTIIRDIQIQNSKAIPVWEILSQIQSRIQSSLEVNVLKQDLVRVEELYKSKGYLNMKIKNKDNVIQYTPGDKYASIVIQLDEGSKTFISKIKIKGLRRAKESMVRSLLKFKKGDILTSLKKEQSIKALGATGLWTDVSISEKCKVDQCEVLVLFNERKPRSFRGGFGLNSQGFDLNSQRFLTTRVYSEITHGNLFGQGRSLTVQGSGQVSFTRSREKPFLEYEVSGRYNEVFVPGYGYYGNISLTQSRNIFSYSSDNANSNNVKSNNAESVNSSGKAEADNARSNNINFVEKTLISFFINKDISEHLKMRWNIWAFENRREACTRLSCPANPQQIASSSLNMAWDKRDNIFDPKGGFLSSLNAEWASPLLGSSQDISFVKLDLQNQFYWTVTQDYTFGLNIKGGVIHATQGSQYIPVSRSFILGGQSSVRGYDGNIEGERIPYASSAPIETANEALRLRKDDFMENVLTSFYGLVNLNIRFPVLENVQGVLFYDLGSVSLEGQTQKILNYGHSVGVGFRYQTFLIPVGLDIAYKLPPKEGSDYRFHFSISW